MRGRTHLAIGIALLLIFLPHLTYKLLSVFVLIIAALLPDIDSPESLFGNKWMWRPLQLFVRHRGILHSLTTCIIISILFAFLIPSIAFPFFLGYSSHLISDSFTKDGIIPFWPIKKQSSGFLRTGGTLETGIFIGFVAVDILLFIALFLK